MPGREPGRREMVLVVVEQRGGPAVGERPLPVVVLVVVHERLSEVVDLDVQLLDQPVDRDDAPVGEVAEPPDVGEHHNVRAGPTWRPATVWNFCAISS